MNVRARDRAAQLGISECELLASTGFATRLEDAMPGLVHALCEVGRCMALTRNEHAVSEVRGRYGGVELGPHAGQVVGEHIDLRVFLGAWRHAYAVNEPHPQRPDDRRRSLQVFDAHGVAVHKVYREADGGDEAAWDAVMQRRTARTAPAPAIEPAPSAAPPRPDGEVEVEGMRAGWDAMTDTHEFFHLLRAYEVARVQALRLAGEQRARRVRNDAIASLLHDSAETGATIMIFVGNRGCIQVFSGAVEKIVRTGPWINVLDPGFNLHLREDRVAASWVVRKPTRAGVVTSLELYDEAGETIAMLFRKRDDRERAEDPAWSAQLERLPEASR